MVFNKLKLPAGEAFGKRSLSFIGTGLAVALAVLLGWAAESRADSGSSIGALIQSGGTPKGFATTLNFSTGTAVSLSGGVATVTASGGGVGGTNTQTGNYTLVSGDSGKLVIMNCASACTVTLFGSPTSTYFGSIISIGSSVATLSLNSRNWDGQATAPSLIPFQALPFYSDGTNYFGGAPPAQGANITFAATAPSLSIAASAGSGGSSTFGTFASLPAATAGALYRATDAPYEFIGAGSPSATWTAFVGGNTQVTVPTAAFSWANQGGASVTTTHGGEILTVPSNSGDSFRTRIIAVPSTPWSIQIAYKLTPWNTTFFSTGVIMYDSVGGRGVVCGIGNLSGGFQAALLQHLTSLTSVNTNVFSDDYLPGNGLIWIKMYNDGTTLHCYESSTAGVTWNQYFSESATAWITTPTSVGYTYNINNTTLSGTLWLLHWLQGTN